MNKENLKQDQNQLTEVKKTRKKKPGSDKSYPAPVKRLLSIKTINDCPTILGKLEDFVLTLTKCMNINEHFVHGLKSYVPKFM
ncbi:hypothetical protein Q8T14_28285, partial [Escherichia coli]|uniref:hypothetical protein n=1 Tax=Escherichia coli TaxID=562 RepID=UPI0027341A85